MSKHTDSGLRCLVAHQDQDNGQCIGCDRCKKWLRPTEFQESECLPEASTSNNSQGVQKAPMPNLMKGEEDNES